jgi:CRISPR system Cascade subunit CasB
MRRSFSRPDHEARGQALRAWHAGLENNKGARARLRRAASPSEVVFEPELHQLLGKLRDVQPSLRVDDPKVRLNLAALVGLAARVKEDTKGVSLARQMGTSGARKSSAGPALSESRFRRLLTAASLDDRYSQLSRAIHLLGGSVDLLSLADALVDWDDDPDLRQHWAYEYYQAALS